MSEGWEIGDLALCVNDRVNPRWGVSLVRLGKIYEVIFVGPIMDNIITGPAPTLSLKGIDDKGIGFSALRFIKITPPKADAFDREVIAAYRGEPVTAHSRDAHTIAPAASIHLAFQPIDNSGCDDADRHRFVGSRSFLHCGSL